MIEGSRRQRRRAMGRSWVLAVSVVGCGAEPGAAPAASAPAATVSAPQPIAASAQAPPTRARLAETLLALQVAPTAHNLIKNPTFDRGRSLPWMTSFTRPADGEAFVEGGALCVEVANAGTNAWDAEFRHREMTIEKGHQYSIRFKFASTTPTTLLAKVGMSGPPYKAYWQQQMELGAEPKVVAAEFMMSTADDPTAEFAFQVGGRSASRQVPFDVCIDDVVLEDPEFTPRPETPPAPIPSVLVNQVGYLPGLAKLAIIRTDSAAPLKWELVDRSARVVSSGETLVHGPDTASGDRVHSADFSSFATVGTGYVLRVGPDASHPFDIGPTVYRKLKYDALHYFYHSRSGIPIVMPYAGDPRWARPAGHLADKSVACAPDAHCDHTLDVSGGWYDAGDHGKYVVNGGFAAWMLVDLYERTKTWGTSAADFGDGKLNIPESHDGLPDLLDEARWELDFFMKMQVPEGKPLAGMVHHKVHDREWTALATRPDQDPIPRWLRPVSTAATLNLAATAAQCARVFKTFDGAFAARCLQAAERAWAAAVANPAMLITSADTVGGGAYEDDDMSDELYWAAAELYVTTRKDAYRDALQKSPHHGLLAVAPRGGDVTPMTWQNVAALGTISLAIASSGPSREEIATARAAIVKVADAYVDIDSREGYRVGFKPDASGKYPWGSNGCVLDAAVVMGLAYDFTKDAKYLDATENAMSYILGRNPMDQSYVTGYGSRPLENPHHRFWAHQANSAFPSAPPGVLSGGPNSSLQDPYVKAAGLRGCAPMKCFADHIEAWSANEEAINWNAALVWVAAYLDEHPKATLSPVRAPVPARGLVRAIPSDVQAGPADLLERP